MTLDAWVQSMTRHRRLMAEVIVPATVDFSVLRLLADHDLTPVLVDVRPALYVLEAERAVPAITEMTVGIYAPHTYGNVPDMVNLRRACMVHPDVSLYAPVERGDHDTFWAMYDRLSPYGRRVGFPEKLEDVLAGWTCFPLLATDTADREGLTTAVQRAGYGAQAPGATPVWMDDRMATLGPWATIGTLDGATTIAARTFTLPLDVAAADALARVLA